FFTLDFLHGVTFDDVFHLNVVEVFDGNTAFVTCFDLSDIVFKSLQLVDLTVMDNNPVPNDTDFVFPGNKTIGDITSGYCSHLRDLKDLSHLDISSDNLFKGWFEHPFDSVLNLVDGIIDDGVMPDLNFFLFRHFLGISRRSNLEAQDDSVRGRSQEHIRFRNLTDTFMDDIDTDFILGKFKQGI